MLPDALIHLANGRVLDQEGKEIDMSEWIQTNDEGRDRYDINFERDLQEEKLIKKAQAQN